MFGSLNHSACVSSHACPELTHRRCATIPRQVTLYRLSADGGPAMAAILPAPLERVEDLQLNADTIAYLADGNDAPASLEAAKHHSRAQYCMSVNEARRCCEPPADAGPVRDA